MGSPYTGKLYVRWERQLAEANKTMPVKSTEQGLGKTRFFEHVESSLSEVD